MRYKFKYAFDQHIPNFVWENSYSAEPKHWPRSTAEVMALLRRATNPRRKDVLPLPPKQ